MLSPPQILLLASVLGAQLGWGALLITQQPSSEGQARSPVTSPLGADQPNGTEANPVKGIAGAPDSISSGRQSGPNFNNDNVYTGPTLNLVPGAYIQFKVAVPVGFYVQLDNTPDGGSLITVISPQLPCVKCDTKIESKEMEGSKPSKFEEDGSQRNSGNAPKYQESQVIPEQLHPSGYASQEESNPPAYAEIGYSKQQIPGGFQPEEYPSESQDSLASQHTRQQVDPPPTNQPSQINSFPQLQPQDAHILSDGSFQLVTHNNPLVPNNPPTLQNYPLASPNNPPVMQNPSAPLNNPPALQSYPSPLPNNPPAMQNPSAPSSNPPALKNYPSTNPNNLPVLQNYPSAPSNPSAMQSRPVAPPNNLPVMQTRPLAPSNTPVIQHFPNTLTRHYYLAPPKNPPAMQNFPNSPSEKQDYQSAVRSLDDARKVQEES